MKSNRFVLGVTAIMCVGVCLLASSVFKLSEEDEAAYDSYRKQSYQNLRQTTSTVVELTERNTSTYVAIPGVATGGSWNASNHNHYAIRQSNAEWSKESLGAGTVGNNGCGLCSLIAVAAELGGVNYTPSEFKAIFEKTVDVGWNYGKVKGFRYAGADTFIGEATAKAELPGTYTKVDSASGSTCSIETTERILEKIVQYCGDSNKVALVSAGGDDAGGGLFTEGGHIMCITDVFTGDDGLIYMHISDSSGTAAKNLEMTWDTMATYGFPVTDAKGDFVTELNGKHYWFSWVYVIERTDL